MGKYTALVDDHLILPAKVRLVEADERVLAAGGLEVPAPVPVRLLIDTGAKRTTLIPGVVDRLGPSFGAGAHLHTPLGSAAVDLYWVRLEFPAGLASFPLVLVARHPMPPVLAHFHGLLGRDLLSRMHSFEYLGRRRRYTLRDAPGWLDWLRRWS
jgi:hypothetical protein